MQNNQSKWHTSIFAVYTLSQCRYSNPLPPPPSLILSHKGCVLLFIAYIGVWFNKYFILQTFYYWQGKYKAKGQIYQEHCDISTQSKTNIYLLTICIFVFSPTIYRQTKLFQNISFLPGILDQDLLQFHVQPSSN